MKQISKNILWNTAGNAAYSFLEWLITVIVTARSGFSGAGTLSIAMSVSLAFRSISYFGIRNYYVTDKSGNFTDNDYTGLRIITCSAAFILCAAFSFISGYSQETFFAIIMFMLYRTVEAFSDLIQGIMQKEERLDIAGICLCIRSVVTFACFTAAYLLSDSLITGLAAMSLSSVLTVIAAEQLMLAKHCNKKLRASREKFSSLIKCVYPMLIYIAGTSVLFNAPKYFLSLMTDSLSVGVYSSVFSMALVLHALFGYIYVPYITRLASAESKSEFTKSLIRVVSALSAAAIIFLIISHFLGAEIMTLIFGECELYDQIILPAVVSVCAYSSLSFISACGVIKRKLSVICIGYIFASVLLVLLSFILIPLYGINGASYSLFISAVTACIIILCSLRSYHFTKA